MGYPDSARLHGMRIFGNHLSHITHPPGVLLKLLFRIRGIDRCLPFLMANLQLSDHLINPDVTSR